MAVLAGTLKRGLPGLDGVAELKSTPEKPQDTSGTDMAEPAAQDLSTHPWQGKPVT